MSKARTLAEQYLAAENHLKNLETEQARLITHHAKYNGKGLATDEDYKQAFELINDDLHRARRAFASAEIRFNAEIYRLEKDSELAVKKGRGLIDEVKRGEKEPESREIAKPVELPERPPVASPDRDKTQAIDIDISDEIRQLAAKRNQVLADNRTALKKMDQSRMTQQDRLRALYKDLDVDRDVT
jgi:hypothetical protein